jgi:sugar phosphate isomerase/epimerase
MKLAVDPHMVRGTPLLELPGLVAELGYSAIELSPREDFMPFFVHPRAGREQMNSEFNGRPEAAQASEAQFWWSMEELLPVFEREGVRLAEVGFDGIATVCVFAWEDRARESLVSNREKVESYAAEHGLAL